MALSKNVLFICIFFLVFDPSCEAMAYLDPGTGSMVLQLILGGIAGVMVVMKMYWQKVKDLFRRKEEE